MKTEWHWVKDNDFPKNGQEVWCVYKGVLGYSCIQLMFVKDLYDFDEYDFISYKGTKQNGFIDMDREYGWYKWNDVICWCELPPLPDELKNKNDD